MQISRSILRLCGRLSAGCSSLPAPKPRRLSSSPPPLCSLASATPRSWPPTLVHRDASAMAASAPPNRPGDRDSRFSPGSRSMATSSKAKGKEKTGTTHSTTCVDYPDEIDDDDALLFENKRCYCYNDPHDPEIYDNLLGVYYAFLLDGCTHRDGSIHKNYLHNWKKSFSIADRQETRLEPMMRSNPTDCKPDRETCSVHLTSDMMQFFSIKLERLFVDVGSVQLYGYLAVRDTMDPLLNYVFNCSRDDPVVVEKGSLIEMTSPKRGINLTFDPLIEFDLRIKTAGEEDDLSLIDGATEIDSERVAWHRPYTLHVKGDCGVVGITTACLSHGVEATVEVVVSQVKSSFDFSLACFTSGIHQEIQLLRCPIDEPCGLRRSVLAVVLDDWVHLKIKTGKRGYGCDVERWCCFKAERHGHSSELIEQDFGSFLVKVTWSTLPPDRSMWHGC